ncbi:MAG TPA: D-glycero-beta-D-manno-heptose 1-phosphate adenylyltransferase [Bacteroidales bacterium]|nr:D-glycero-beta-D-manno-heptose 1-phosphate adenylyltransferase [Bacteroidales bacterium]
MDLEYLVQKKVFSSDSVELQRLVAHWRFKNLKIVFTNGCFDLVHLGHIDYLTRAAELGDVLAVGLNSDDSARRIKGEGRPIMDQNSRSLLLASFLFVDAVIIFDQETPLELIRLIQPDILVKGADYKPEKIVGADIVTGNGGEVVTLPYLQGYSTSFIEKKIRQGS